MEVGYNVLGIGFEYLRCTGPQLRQLSKSPMNSMLIDDYIR